MSHFLGPIHYLMMERVQRVADRERALADRAIGIFGPPVAQAVDEARDAFGYDPPEGPLEEAVGGANIHEFLSQQVYRVEASEAAVVQAVLATVGGRGEKPMCEAAYYHGRATGETLRTTDERVDGQDLQGLVMGLTLALLDGMPCDHATAVTEQAPGRVVLRRSLAVHREAWEAAGADVGFMAELIGRWSAGLVEAINPKATFSRTVYLDGVGWCKDELVL